MGKLAQFVAMKKEMTFEIEHELRAIRDLMLGPERLAGSYYVMELGASQGYVTGTEARVTFVRNLQGPLNELLLQYAHDLALEGLELGVPEERIERALSGEVIPLWGQGEQPAQGAARAPLPGVPPPIPAAASPVYLATSA